MLVSMSIQQQARVFPCYACGARPGEFCRTSAGRKSYTAHLSRLEQENDAWLAGHAIGGKVAACPGAR
jgi:hypothetical protein